MLSAFHNIQNSTIMNNKIQNFIESLKHVKATTVAGQAFVNEALSKAKKVYAGFGFANWVLESASKTSDASLNAFARQQSAILNKDSFAFKAQLVQEALDMSESDNMQLAGETLESAIDVAGSDVSSLIAKIAVDKVLDKYDMYPEVADLIAQAKNLYYQNNDTAAMETGKVTKMLVVIDEDIMGWPQCNKWFALQPGTSLLQYAQRQPSDVAMSLMRAMQLVTFNFVSKRFVIDTCIGHVEISAANSIVLDGNVIDANAFAERVQDKMQAEQVQMQVANVWDTNNAITNAVVVIANYFDMISLLDDSLAFNDVLVAVYKNDNIFNLIDCNTGTIEAYQSVTQTVAALQQRVVAQANIDCFKAMFATTYEDERNKAIASSAKLQAYLTVFEQVNGNIANVMEKMQTLNPESEGYAAHQQILDRYNAEAETLRLEIDKLQNELANLA